MRCRKRKAVLDANCLSCHKPTMSQQLTEVSEWVTGNMPLYANETYGLRLGSAIPNSLASG